MKIIIIIITLLYCTSSFATKNIEDCKEKLRVLQPENFADWEFIGDQNKPLALNSAKKQMIQFLPLYYDHLNNLKEVIKAFCQDVTPKIIEESEKYTIFEMEEQGQDCICKVEWQGKLSGKAIVWVICYCAKIGTIEMEETVKRLKNVSFETCEQYYFID